MDVITNPYWDYDSTMLVKRVPSIFLEQIS